MRPPIYGSHSRLTHIFFFAEMPVSVMPSVFLRIASTFNGWPRLWGKCDAIVVLSGRHVLFCKMTKPYQLFSFCALCGGAHNLKRLLLHVKLSEHHNFSSHLVKWSVKCWLLAFSCCHEASRPRDRRQGRSKFCQQAFLPRTSLPMGY